MPIDIPTGITSLNGAIQLGKALVNASAEMDKAELKLKIADLVSELLSAKESLVDAKSAIREMDEEIARLVSTNAEIDLLLYQRQ